MVLTNYNDGDPYRNLVYFAQQSEQVQPNGEIQERNTELRYGDHTCSECDHEETVQYPPEGEGDYAEWDCGECGHWHETEI